MRCYTIHAIYTRFRIFGFNPVILFMQVIVVNSDHIHYNIVHNDTLFGHIIYGRNFRVKRKFAVCMSVVAVVTSGDDVCSVNNDTSMFFRHSTFFGVCDRLLDKEVVLVHSKICAKLTQSITNTDRRAIVKFTATRTCVYNM